MQGLDARVGVAEPDPAVETAHDGRFGNVADVKPNGNWGC